MVNVDEELVLNFLSDNPRKKCTFEYLLQNLGMEEDSLNALLKGMREKDLVFLVDGNVYRTREQAGIQEGYISINRAGLGFLDREDRDSIKIEESDQLGAMDGDKVLVQCQLWQVYGRVLKILERKRTHVIGTFRNNGHSVKLILDDEKLQDKPLKVLYAEDFHPVEGLKVQCTIEKYSGPLTVRVSKTIGYEDDPGVDILSILLDHDIHSEFPVDVMDQVKTIPQEVQEKDLEGRMDLTHDITVTIDGDDSKDFDDAVSCVRTVDGYLLKVSIADVSHYVTKDSPLDKEAFHRGCSTYVTDRVVPMLPHELSNGICSLNPYVIRLTLTCEMHVDKHGLIKEYVIYPSFIQSTERMTYNNVNKILDGNEELREKYSHLGDLFEVLAECADKIRYQRVKKGAISFDSDESHIVVDKDGHPIDIVARTRGHAEEIIEDCMIAANVCVANQMKWTEIPSIYRIHEEPSARRVRDYIKISELLGHKFIVGKGDLYPNEVQRYLDSVSDTNEFPVLSRLMLRTMQKARYDAHCVGHFGLAEEEYLHFTSPIRRYPDLIVHRMLRKYLFNGCTDFNEIKKDEQYCQEASDQSSLRERNSQDAEYECEDMKKAEYMENRIGMIAEGVITSVTGFGFFVELENTVEGLVPMHSLYDDFYNYDAERMELVGQRTHRTYRIGMKVKIRVVSASKENKRIDFELEGKNGKILSRKKEVSVRVKKEKKPHHHQRHTERKGIVHGRKRKR